MIKIDPGVCGSNRNAYSVAWRAFKKSMAHGWAIMSIRVSTIQVLAAAFNSDVVLPLQSPAWQDLSR
jgi:hypothetical protein